MLLKLATFVAGWCILHRLSHSAATASSPEDAAHLQQCIISTIQRLFHVAAREEEAECAASGIGAAHMQLQSNQGLGLQQQQQQQMEDVPHHCIQAVAKEWVQAVVGCPEPTSHYQGQQVMLQIRQQVQQLSGHDVRSCMYCTGVTVPKP